MAGDEGDAVQATTATDTHLVVRLNHPRASRHESTERLAVMGQFIAVIIDDLSSEYQHTFAQPVKQAHTGTHKHTHTAHTHSTAHTAQHTQHGSTTDGTIRICAISGRPIATLNFICSNLPPGSTTTNAANGHTTAP